MAILDGLALSETRQPGQHGVVSFTLHSTLGEKAILEYGSWSPGRSTTLYGPGDTTYRIETPLNQVYRYQNNVPKEAYLEINGQKVP